MSTAIGGEESRLALHTPRDYSREQVELIKNTICVGATDNELSLFVQTAKRMQLDPFARQIFAVKRWNRQAGREVMSTQVSIDGFRLVAERTGKYAGQLGPFWTADGKEWVDVWLAKEPPRAAKVGVLRHDFKEPVWAVATWDEYKQEGKNGLSPMWAKMGALMLAKCAESLGLRRAFPNELSGVYSDAEMAQATVVEVVEPTDPGTNETIRGALGDAPKGVAPVAAPATAATTSKKTTAADIPHEGIAVTPDQIKLIHVLRGKCGGVYSGDEGRPQWIKIIQVYRNQAGERAKSSTDLSRNQASHLIDRMNGYLAKVTARAEQATSEIAGVVNGSPELEKLIADIDSTGDEERLTAEICDTLRVMQVGDLVTPDRVSAAFALVAAWKTNSYEMVKARIIARMDP